MSDLPLALPGDLARRLASALDVEGKILRGLEALGTWSAPGLRQRVMLDTPYLRIPIRIVE